VESQRDLCIYQVDFGTAEMGLIHIEKCARAGGCLVNIADFWPVNPIAVVFPVWVCVERVVAVAYHALPGVLVCRRRVYKVFITDAFFIGNVVRRFPAHGLQSLAIHPIHVVHPLAMAFPSVTSCPPFRERQPLTPRVLLVCALACQVADGALINAAAPGQTILAIESSVNPCPALVLIRSCPAPPPSLLHSSEVR
jgi:hypothetical protein